MPQRRLSGDNTCRGNSRPQESSHRPHWDGDRRLYWHGVVVKKFKYRPPESGVILNELERRGWPLEPFRFPLDPAKGRDATWLANTVGNLNRVIRGIRVFHTDGATCLGWRPKG
jgi:hypothetical protein